MGTTLLSQLSTSSCLLQFSFSRSRPRSLLLSFVETKPAIHINNLALHTFFLQFPLPCSKMTFAMVKTRSSLGNTHDVRYYYCNKHIIQREFMLIYVFILIRLHIFSANKDDVPIQEVPSKGNVISNLMIAYISFGVAFILLVLFFLAIFLSYKKSSRKRMERLSVFVYSFSNNSTV